MRYYNIAITNPSSGAVVKQYTSFVNGQSIANALNIEIDVFSYQFAQPAGQSLIRVWGISLQEIAQAQNFVGMNIVVSAGMQKGLPLASPAQAGVILSGQIYQSVGNWINTDMTLDLYAAPYVGTVGQPANVSFSWTAGVPLATAIANTLAAAFPKFKTNININPNLVLANDENGYYNSLTEFAQWAAQKSKAVIGGNYQGVQMTITQNTINVYDGTTQTNPKTINFNDLIGQPTWIEAPTIQFKTVMRADVVMADYITLPQTLATATQQSLIGTPLRSKPVFQGTFQVVLVRHVGNYRQPDAASWVTIYNANPVPVTTTP